MRYICLLIFVICSASAFAEGLPIIDGRIEENQDYTMLEFNSSQVEEIQILGSLTLTSEQWRELKKVGPQCPKRFTTLLPSDYQGCTCGQTGYIVLFPGNKGAVFHSVIAAEDSDLRSVFAHPTPFTLGSIWDEYHHKHLTIAVSTEGEFYLGGMSIPYEKTKAWLALPQTEFRDGKIISIPTDRSLTLKLAMGSRPTQSAINRVIAYRQAALDAGWDVDVQNYEGWGLKYKDPQSSSSLRDDLSSDTAVGK